MGCLCFGVCKLSDDRFHLGWTAGASGIGIGLCVAMIGQTNKQTKRAKHKKALAAAF
jgi:hypothetical protein